ncbi:FlgO family outer membrane protein [Psychromonas hadalis]|uniref:FlgO family outer membrane protein n=1 Tax=Psychromonas hadalis TaxID=211669 RepID=UPI0003B6FC91|nr:FlgO family outer membrane protein [Psychromonas hadalis]
MKKLLLVGATLFLLQACSTINDTEKTEPTVEEEKKVQSTRKNSDDYLYYYIAHSFSQADVEKEVSDVNRETSGVQTESNGYGHLYSFNGEKSLILSEVVSKMADQLLYNFPKKYHNETIALTSIVDLNDHKVTNWLGQTISEQLIHELHIRHLRVIDFKLTGNIQLTEAGEFALTRDWTKLNKNLDVQRILTGTMSRNEEGMILNIRIVNANSNLVESTSSAFVPHSMFVGGQYDYSNKKYYARDSRFAEQKKAQVRLVK